MTAPKAPPTTIPAGPPTIKPIRPPMTPPTPGMTDFRILSMTSVTLNYGKRWTIIWANALHASVQY